MVRLASAVLAVLLMVSGLQADEGERPKIFLEKKIFTETSAGGKSFYEVHTVKEGENLWNILSEKSPIFPADFPSLLREFRRANPDVTDPGKLLPGQKILVPAGIGMKTARLVETGRTVAYRIRKGDSLTAILTSRGVARGDLSRYLAAVQELNDSIRDVNVIIAGKTILIPTEEYFGKKPVVVAEVPPEAPPAASPPSPPEEIPSAPPAVIPPAPPAVAAPAPPAAVPPAPPTIAAPAPPAAVPPAPPAIAAPAPPVPPRPPAPEAQAVPLTKDVPAEPGGEVLPPARPESRVAVPAPPPPESSVVITGRKTEEPAPPPLPQPKPPYRGLLSDLARGLGERWVDRGTLYLPIPSGGEVVLDLEEYPVVRFSSGIQALIDFRGALPYEIRRLIVETWKNYRVVPMGGAADAEEMIDRLLAASGYHSVKEGLARPPVIGEAVSVALPARWVVLRTDQSLLTGEIILVKGVPEKPDRELSAVIRYAGRVGIRVLPFAYDPSAHEGFLAGIDPGKETEREEPGEALPQGGLEALDFSLDLLGIPASEKKRIRIGGSGESFLLTVQPERMFEAGGKRFVVDTGRMSSALRSIVQNSGYTVFVLGKGESGRSILRRLLDASGISSEERKDHLLAGGKEAGFEVRATGTFLTSRRWLEARKVREAVLVRGKVHSATRSLLDEIGVEIVEW